jgi:hypothetical protein
MRAGSSNVAGTPSFWMMLRSVRPFRWLVMAAVSATILALLFPPRLSLFSSSLGTASYGNRAGLTLPPPIPTGPGGLAAPPLNPLSPVQVAPAVPVAPPLQNAGAPASGGSQPAVPASPPPTVDITAPVGPRAADEKPPALVPLSGARREAAPPQPGSQPLAAPARPVLNLKPSE